MGSGDQPKQDNTRVSLSLYWGLPQAPPPGLTKVSCFLCSMKRRPLNRKLWRAKAQMKRGAALAGENWPREIGLASQKRIGKPEKDWPAKARLASQSKIGQPKQDWPAKARLAS